VWCVRARWLDHAGQRRCLGAARFGHRSRRPLRHRGRAHRSRTDRTPARTQAARGDRVTADQLIGAGVLAATLRLATPILLAALGGVVSERAGVVNIALEGCMLVGAFFGVVAADQSHSVVVALVAAMAVGAGLAAIHAVAAIHLRSDQIVSGMALNILALGLTTYLDYQMYGTTGTPADLVGLPDVQLGFLGGVPYVGDAIGTQNSMVWVMGLLVVGLQLFLFRTVAGLRL